MKSQYKITKYFQGYTNSGIIYEVPMAYFNRTIEGYSERMSIVIPLKVKLILGNSKSRSILWVSFKSTCHIYK